MAMETNPWQCWCSAITVGKAAQGPSHPRSGLLQAKMAWRRGLRGGKEHSFYHEPNGSPQILRKVALIIKSWLVPYGSSKM